MRIYLLAAVAAAAIATPALAKDNSPYVGVEGGVMFPRNQDVSARSTSPRRPTACSDFAASDVGELEFKTGYDVDLIGGYDFGMFRLEGELGYKRAKAKSVSTRRQFRHCLQRRRRHAVHVDGDFDLGGHVSVLSGMVNGLVDFGGNDGIGGYFGAGVGCARVKEFGESDSGLAWQLLAGDPMPRSATISISA